MNVFCTEEYEYLTYRRLIHELKNKDSILYRTLLLAISQIEYGKKRYIIPKRLSEKIFISIGIRKCN